MAPRDGSELGMVTLQNLFGEELSISAPPQQDAPQGDCLPVAHRRILKIFSKRLLKNAKSRINLTNLGKTKVVVADSMDLGDSS